MCMRSIIIIIIIIIIINEEKIKSDTVTSRRCRGTVHNLNKHVVSTGMSDCRQ